MAAAAAAAAGRGEIRYSRRQCVSQDNFPAVCATMMVVISDVWIGEWTRARLIRFTCAPEVVVATLG